MTNTFDIHTAGTREIRSETRDRFGANEISVWFNGRRRISDGEPITRQSDMHEADWRQCYIDLSERVAGEPVETATAPEPTDANILEAAKEIAEKPADSMAETFAAMRALGMDKIADRIETAVASLERERDNAKAAADKAAKAAAVPVAPVKPGEHVATVEKTVNVADLIPNAGSTLRDRNIMVDVCNHPLAPAFDKTYLWGEHFPDMIAALVSGMNVLAYGAKGTGKSSAARNIAAMLGRPYFQIGFHAETSSAELFGFPGPDGDGMSWVPGDLLIAMQTPHAVIDLSEISFARPELTAQLFSVLERTDRTVLAGGVKYHVHPTAWFIGTSNDNGSGELSHRYHGTRPMNPALVSRFQFRVEFTTPTATRLAKMIARATNIPLPAAQEIAGFEKAMESGVKAGDCEDTPGIRSMLAWAELVMIGTESRKAFEYAVINSAPTDDAAYWGQRAAQMEPHAIIDRAVSGQPVPAKPEPVETRNGFTATETAPDIN